MRGKQLLYYYPTDDWTIELLSISYGLLFSKKEPDISNPFQLNCHKHLRLVVDDLLSSYKETPQKATVLWCFKN